MTTEATRETMVDTMTAEWMTTMFPMNRSIFYYPSFTWPIFEKVLDFHEHFLSTVPWIALVANAISFTVFTYKLRHSRSEQTVNWVLAYLAVADTLSLTVGFDYTFSFWGGWSLMVNTMAGCKILTWLQDTARDCSCYFVLIFTFDRFISVRFPLQKSLWVTRRRVSIAMMIVLLVSGALESHNLVLMEHIVRFDHTCESSDKDLTVLLSLYIRRVYGFIVPAVSVLIFNLLIIYQLAVWGRKRAAMTGSETQNRSLTVLLVTVSTWSFLVSLPNTAYRIYHVVEDPSILDYTDMYMSWGYILYDLDVLNHTCNFFFYCVSGSRFRRDMLRILFILFTCGQVKHHRLLGTTTDATRSTAMTTNATGMSMTTKVEANGSQSNVTKSMTSLSTVATVITNGSRTDVNSEGAGDQSALP